MKELLDKEFKEAVPMKQFSLQTKSLLFSIGFGFLIWTLSGCSSPKSAQGVYEITGASGSIATTIIYSPSGAGSSVTVSSANLPWSDSFMGTESEGSYQGSAVYLSAYDPNSSPITFNITEDGASYQHSYATSGTSVTLIGNF